MGSILKFVKGLGTSFMNLPTSTKLKIISGVVFLGGGIAVATGALQDDDVEPLVIDGKTMDTALPEGDNDEIIEVEPVMVTEEN